MAKNGKKFTHKEWTLLVIFVIYWFIVFPIIWFVVHPSIFLAHKHATILWAIMFIIIYATIHCFIYICFKHYEQKRAKEPERRLSSLPKGVTPEDIRNRQRSMDAALYVPNKRRISKPVEPPKVPNRVENQTNESEKSYGTTSRPDSNVTIPFYIKESEDGKLRFVSSYELYYDGQRFHDEV